MPRLSKVVGVGRSEDLSQIICRDLLPALRAERGFSGAVSLVDRETESTLLLVFWETEEEAAAPATSVFRRPPRQARRPRSGRPTRPGSGRSARERSRGHRGTATARREKTGGSPRCECTAAAPTIAGTANTRAAQGSPERRRTHEESDSNRGVAPA